MSETPVDQDARRQIGEDTDRTLFVSAGAGSGKTTALVGRVARLVLHDGIPMPAIATVTFTIKAAAELRDRLRAEFERHATAENIAAEQRHRAQAALESLDLAAIGTLHSFAQRILAAHPIEAGLPPALEVLDEVASSIAFEERWSRLQQQLLDDDDIAEPLITGMAAGVTLRHLRQLVRLLSNDWDRIATHVLRTPEPALTLPRLDTVNDGLRELTTLAGLCTDPSDKLLAKVGELQAALSELATTADIPGFLEAIRAVDAFMTGSGGKAASWSGRNPTDLRAQLREIQGRALLLKQELIGACLRHLTQWAGSRVLTEAQDRRRSGQLEFHDLLVLSRELLATSPEARATLHDRYQRLLLDEFQDTDPIQIELAVRIAGGRDAHQSRWEDVHVPDGRLFVVGDAKQSIYRFRRASIRTYLDAQQAIGDTLALSTNFRSHPGIVDWVNGVFGQLISFKSDSQPDYEALSAHRTAEPGATGAAVTVLGIEEHPPKTSAEALRRGEAADVAGVIAQIKRENWTIFDESTKEWRKARPADIAILIPARTSMPMLEDALDEAGVHYRAESMSLVYEAPEVRDLLVAARAIADPSDALSLVAALRSPLFACGDDDLWRWRHAGARIDLFAKPAVESQADSPVGSALSYLQGLYRRSQWLTPSEVLACLIEERRLLEISAHLPRTRDSWRRLRFVVDQARAWTETAHGGLRAYLDWVDHQAQEKTRASEAVLPEQDVDAVRVMTVHAAKGLEFPIVILSGMSTQPRRQAGVRLLWTSGGYAVSLNKDLTDPSFETEAALDEQMGEHERTRLLYVAATRARDHLVVSLHRKEGTGSNSTPAEQIYAAGGATITTPNHFRLPTESAPPERQQETATPPPDYIDWSSRIAVAQATSRLRGALTASGLEGTEPEVAMAEADEAGLAKGPRHLELPPWTKGRYGSAVGRAVHGVLQTVDLGTGVGLDNAVSSQVVAEGIVELTDIVTQLARSALTSELVKRAAARTHWREIYVGAPREDGTLVEGIIDLLYREDDGSLTVVDYKTDVITDDTLGAKTAYYRPQLEAYAEMLAKTTGQTITPRLLFLHPQGAVDVDLSALPSTPDEGDSG